VTVADGTFLASTALEAGVLAPLSTALSIVTQPTHCPDDHKREVQTGDESHDARGDTLPHPRH
jgi:hypothetical protein